MNWESKHKLTILSVVIIFIALVSFYIFYDKIFPAPMCSDKIKNGTETGVDCGGPCLLRCQSEIKPIKIIWVKPIKTDVDTYDVAALLSNENKNSAPYLLNYKMSLFDTNGKSVWSATSTIKVPVLSDFPVIIQNVKIKDEIKNANIELEESVSFLTDDRYNTEIVDVLNTKFENGETPRLYATIKNKTLIPVLRFPIRAVLYDPLKNTLGVGETYIERLGKDETRQIVFTWTNKFSEMPSIIRVYPIVDPYVNNR